MFECFFPNVERLHIVIHIKEDKSLTIPSHSNKELSDILNQLLCLDYKERPSASEALSHKFFLEPWDFTSIFLEHEKWIKKTNQFKFFDFSDKSNDSSINNEMKYFDELLKELHNTQSVK